MSARTPYIVLGAGAMGRAIAYDLLRFSPGAGITIADIDEERAKSAAASLGGRAEAVRFDADDVEDVVRLLKLHTTAISAVTYHHNYRLLDAAITAGTHFCDLGHDDGIVDRQLGESQRASGAGITAIVNCGLAPGLADILAMHAYRQLDAVDALTMKVGGLPQHPHPPFNYQLVFSAEGLLEEYTLNATVLRDGKIRKLDSLTEIEELSFPPPFGTLEAFHTGGGASRLPHLLEGKVRTLEYKTIRYPGHCVRMKTLLDLGFAENDPLNIGGRLITSRELFLELLKKRLTFDEPDAVLLLVSATGTKNGAERRIAYRMVDLYDQESSNTAMMRTTSFPAAIAARMIAEGVIEKRGVFAAEEIVPAEPLIAELKKRAITIETLRTP